MRVGRVSDLRQTGTSVLQQSAIKELSVEKISDMFNLKAEMNVTSSARSCLVGWLKE